MTRALQFAAVGLLFFVPMAVAQQQAPCAAPARKIVPCSEAGGLVGEAPPASIATLDGTPITLADLDDAARKKVEGLDAAISAAREKAQREDAADRLLEREAKRRGVTTGQLLADEVFRKVSWPSEEDITAEVESNPNKYKRGDEVRRELAAGNLFDRRLAAREKEFVSGLEKEAPVRSESGLHVETVILDARIAAMQAQKKAIDKLVHDRLLAAEAAKKGITAEELVNREVTAKITAPTEAELKADWEKWKRVYGAELDKVRDQVVESVQSDKKEAAEKAFDQRLRNGHELRLLFDVPERPRQSVDRAESPASGSRDARVVVVEFGDFQCPPCGRMSGVVEEALKPYGKRVRYVFREFPMSFHTYAWKAAEAGLAAHAQGKFAEYAHILFANQDKLGVDALKEYATKAELDRKRFDADLDSGRYLADVLIDKRVGERAGVPGTPVFFINGVRLGVEGYSVEGLRAAIDREMAK